MNENIDLTKILKDCPKGTKLYSPISGEVYFKEMRSYCEYSIITTNDVCTATFTKEGFYRADADGECLLFPSKEQRDWSKFTAPWYKKEQLVNPKFKVGDWVVRGNTIAQILDIQEQYYIGLDTNGKDFVSSRFLNDDKIHLWTLQDAKDGSVLVNGSNIFIFHFINNRRLMGYCHVNMDDGNLYNDIGRNECFCTIDAPIIPATKEQRDLLFQKIKEACYKWSDKTKTLEKLIKPKFKVGDRIRHKETNKDDVYEISKVYDDSYGIDGTPWMINMEDQDLYELVPNKFDPKTLQTFDRVITRCDHTYTWSCDFFSYVYSKLLFICLGGQYKQCIPYNDETKHLVGTTEEAPEYYRYWED